MYKIRQQKNKIKMLNMLLEIELFVQQSLENFKDGDCAMSLGNLLHLHVSSPSWRKRLFLNSGLNLKFWL